jgi:hypothetical protein
MNALPQCLHEAFDALADVLQVRCGPSEPAWPKRGRVLAREHGACSSNILAEIHTALQKCRQIPQHVIRPSRQCRSHFINLGEYTVWVLRHDQVFKQGRFNGCQGALDGIQPLLPPAPKTGRKDATQSIYLGSAYIMLVAFRLRLEILEKHQSPLVEIRGDDGQESNLRASLAREKPIPTYQPASPYCHCPRC